MSDDSHPLTNEARFRALNIRERLSLLASPRPSQQTYATLKNETRNFYLRRWRQQKPLDTTANFRDMLHSFDASPKDFFHILDHSPDLITHSQDKGQGWWDEVGRLLDGRRGRSLEWLPEELQTRRTSRFLLIAEPLVTPYLDQVKDLLDSYRRDKAEINIGAGVWRCLTSRLAHTLYAQIVRAVVLELNVHGLQGELNGDSPATRFKEFLTTCEDGAFVQKFFEEYSVLTRLVPQAAEHWAASSCEILERLEQDRLLLNDHFQIALDQITLEEVICGLGDTHADGRTVARLTFSDGTKLIYKPRSLAIDRAFYQCLDDLASIIPHEFPKPQILDRGSHGWMEFVSHYPCSSKLEVEGFYHRLGSLMAILTLLGATDLHGENIIAAGPNPVIVDLETALRPSLRTPDSSSGEFAMEARLKDSVLTIGLLPHRRWITEDSQGLDTSGIARRGGQAAPQGAMYWSEVGSDEMKLVKGEAHLGDSTNVPVLDGEPVDPKEFQINLLEGFEATYGTLARSKSLLSSKQGPFKHFSGCHVRVVVRHTGVYAKLLERSYHPDFLRDACERDRLFSTLWLMGERASSYDRRSELIQTEREALWKNDIPYFYTTATGCELRDCDGNVWENYFTESALEGVRRRCENMSSFDMDFQKGLIEASFTTAEMVSWQEPKTASCARTERLRYSREFLDAAREVGQRLAETALIKDECANWMGLRLLFGRHWTVGALGVDLYSGLPGVCIFLAYLAKVTHDKEFELLARQTWNSIDRRLNRFGHQIEAVGAFEGWGAIIYLLAHLSQLWEDEKLIETAKNHEIFMESLLAQERRLDLIGGSSGAIGALLALFSVNQESSTLDLATRFGMRLMDCSEELPDGSRIWHTSFSPKVCLTGFSHGAAGFAWAAARLAEATGCERFKYLASSSLKYERSHFSHEVGNWPDLRWVDDGEEPSYMNAWCHGAPGIGLSRVELLGTLDDDQLTDEVEWALASTRRFGFGNNHSLCHGDLGNLELIDQAANTLQDTNLRLEADKIAGGVLENIEKEGWRCGVPRGVETPGFMPGLSGIGFGLLRKAAPEVVPSILTLEAPLK